MKQIDGRTLRRVPPRTTLALRITTDTDRLFREIALSRGLSLADAFTRMVEAARDRSA